MNTRIHESEVPRRGGSTPPIPSLQFPVSGTQPAPSWRSRGERGQTIVFVLLALSLFLLAAAGLTVDIANMYFHRQMAQSAADAACTAGAMDMYNIDLALLNGSAVPTSQHFVQGSAFDCGSTTPNTMSSGSTAPTPCQYASVNGYTSPSTFAGLTAGTPSNNVYVSFPSASSAPVPGVTAAPSVLAPYPFMRVDVVDRVKVFLMGLLTGSKTQDVRAFAVCGLLYPPSVQPIDALNPGQNWNPTSPGNAAMDLDNNSLLAIIGGPPVSISVSSSFASNSSNLSTSATIDLSKGGPNQTGSVMDDTGGFQVLGGGVICGAITPCVLASACIATGSYCGTSSASAGLDPYALTAAPTAGALPAGVVATGVAAGTNGCPAPSGSTCLEYSAGTYPNGIGTAASGHSLQNPASPVFAIFDPGAYFITGGMTMWGNVCVRPSTAAGDGSAGTMFYFSDTKSVSISTSSNVCSTGTAYSSSLLNCPGNSNSLPTLPLTGDVFVGPCSGTWGDPLGTSDPAGEQRGLVFFQNRNQTPTSNQNCVNGVITGSTPCLGPLIGGAGGVLTVGTMYFHQCHTSGGLDTGGTGCTASNGSGSTCTGGYCTNVYFAGTSKTTAAGLGNIVADNIRMTQNSQLTMDLNPAAYLSVLKIGLLR